MAVERKTLFPEHLENAPVFLLDTDPKSRYFKITDLPDTFTGGKNSFSIQGSVELVPNSLIHIEIKDAQGIRIYHEVADGGINDYYEGVSKPVAVYIYDDTAFGECTITILGEVSQYQIDGVKYNIPDEWVGIPNVKWQTKVNVYPFLANTTRIRFYKRPKVDIEERTLFVYRRTIEKKTITGYCKGYVGPNVNSGQNYLDDYYYTIESIAPSIASLATGSYLNQLYGGTSPYFDNTITASILTEPKLVDTYLELNNIVSNQGYPAIGPISTRTLLSKGGLSFTAVTTPTKRYTKWRSKVKRILGNNTILATGFGLDGLYKYSAPPNLSILNLSEGAGVNDPLFNQRTENPWAQNLFINDFAYAEFTASYEIENYIPSRVSSSYAYIKLTDLETFSGDVYRVKVYAKSKNDLQGYTLLEDLSLESQELLEERLFYNEPYYKSGFFTNNRNIPELWSWSYADPAYSSGIQEPYIDNTTGSLFLQNSAVLTPALNLPEDENIGIYKFWNSKPIDFVGTSDYKVTLLPLVESYGTSSLAISRPNIIDIYMSGSAFASGTQNFNIENSEYGRKIGEIQTIEPVKLFDKQEFTFSPLRTGTGNIQFIVRNGRWKLSEISITPLRETAVSPPEYSFYTYPELAIPSQSFDFRFEFFDINYNYVPVRLEKSIQFAGTNVIEPNITATVYKNTLGDGQNFFTLSSISASTANESELYIDITVTGTPDTDIQIISQSQSDSNVGARFSGSSANVAGQPVGDGPPTLIYPGKLTFDSFAAGTYIYRIPWTDFIGSFSSPAEVYDVRYKVQLTNRPSVFTTFRVYRQRNVPATTTTTTTTSTTTSTTTIPITGSAEIAIRNYYLVPEYTSYQPECFPFSNCDCYKNNLGIDTYKGDHKIVDVKVGGTSITKIPGGGAIGPIYSDSIYTVIDRGTTCELNWAPELTFANQIWVTGSIGTSAGSRRLDVIVRRNTVGSQYHADDLPDGILRLTSVNGFNASTDGNNWANSVTQNVQNSPGDQTFIFWIRQTTTPVIAKDFRLEFYDGGTSIGLTCCFMPGTLITMADGSTKPIENIVEGDTVLSYDETNDTIIENVVKHIVVKERKDVYKITFDNENYVEISPDHPIYSINKGWVSISPITSKLAYSDLDISMIEIGDIIKSINGNSSIISIEKYNESDYTTYTFGVENETGKSYFANGIVAHNVGSLVDNLCGQDLTGGGGTGFE